MVNLNKKADILISKVEAYMKDKIIYLPESMQKTVRPLFATLRAFLFMTPEKKLQRYLDNLKMLLETIETETTEKGFTEHLEELTTLWN